MLLSAVNGWPDRRQPRLGALVWTTSLLAGLRQSAARTGVLVVPGTLR